MKIVKLTKPVGPVDAAIRFVYDDVNHFVTSYCIVKSRKPINLSMPSGSYEMCDEWYKPNCECGGTKLKLPHSHWCPLGGHGSRQF